MSRIKFLIIFKCAMLKSVGKKQVFGTLCFSLDFLILKVEKEQCNFNFRLFYRFFFF